MRYRVEVSDQAHEQLSRFPRDVQERMKRAIDELEANDDSQWNNVKALQGAQWKGRFRKRVGAYRIIFRKFPDRGVAAISAVIIKSSAFFSAPAPALFSNSSSSAVVISIASVITPSAIQPRSPVGGRGIGGEYLGRLTRCAAG